MTEQSSGSDGNNSKGRSGRRRRRRGKRGKGSSEKSAASSQEQSQKSARPSSGGGNSEVSGKSGKGRKRRRGSSSSDGGKSPEPQKKKIQLKPFQHVLRKYGVLIFDTFEAAYRDLEKIKEQTSDVDQLNVVIRAEGNMDDPKLTEIDKVKVFAGTAWALIHDRRIEDGWYNEPQ